MCTFSTTTTEQKKRAEAGKKLIKKIKVKGTSGTFEGSGKNPYKVTLESCTCGDYIRHHEPCKHMFALAYRLKAI